jgi:hypothetical protein
VETGGNILFQGKDGTIINLQIGSEKLPDLLVWLGGVYMAAPDPFHVISLVIIPEGCGLWVVNNHHVIFKVNASGVILVLF